MVGAYPEKAVIPKTMRMGETHMKNKTQASLADESKSKQTVTFGPFVGDRYWPAVSPDLCADWRRTVEQYHLPALVNVFGNRQLGGITPEDVAIWWGELRRRPMSPTTCNKLLARLKHVFSKAVEWDYLAQSPARFLKRARESRGRVRYFTDEQRTLLFEKANPNLRLYLLAASYTGARRRSLLELRQGDIDWNLGTITFRDTKNGEDHAVPLHPALRAVLVPRRTDNPDAFVLPRYQPAALSRAFKRLTQRLGFEDFRFHTWRHDVASRLALAGANQRLIMAVLGHKDPRASIRYTHLSQERVRQIMESTL